MSPSSPTGGPPLRAVAMVLIALAIVFGGLGAFSLSSSNSSSSSSSSSAASTPTSATTSGGAQPGASPSSSSASTSAVSAPQSQSPETTAAAPTTTPGASSDQAGSVDKSVPVRVLNNSMVHGLAATFANRLRSYGWTNLSTGNYPASDAELAHTTVYYGDAPGEQAAAQAVAADLGATALPRSKGVALPKLGVVVIVTSE